MISADQARETAQRLLKKYDRQNKGHLDRSEVQEMLSDIYKNGGIDYKPSISDIDSYLSTIDENKDKKICLSDLENLSIKYLCIENDIPKEHKSHASSYRVGGYNNYQPTTKQYHQAQQASPQYRRVEQPTAQQQYHRVEQPSAQQQYHRVENPSTNYQQQQYHRVEQPSTTHQQYVQQPRTYQQQQQSPSYKTPSQIQNPTTYHSPSQQNNTYKTYEQQQQVPYQTHQYQSIQQPNQKVPQQQQYKRVADDRPDDFISEFRGNSIKIRKQESVKPKVNSEIGAVYSSKNIYKQKTAYGMSQNRQVKCQGHFKCKDADVVGYKEGVLLKQAIAQAQRSGQKFTDRDFPPNTRTLSRQGEWFDGYPIPSTDWVRPEEHFRNGHKLFFEGIMPGDVRQGQLGDCYFQCSLAALAEWPERIQRIFSSPETNQWGAYSIWAVFNGVQQEVLVDDNLWYDKRNRDFISMQSNGEEIWPQIIEKAWAKLNKDYLAIDGGFARDVLHDLTGAPVIHYRIAEEHNWRKYYDLLWNQLLIGEKENFVMCGGTYGEDPQGNVVGDTESRDGIFFSHAYSILAAYEIIVDGRTVKLCKLRNPHGEGEYNGRFSDRDSVWSRISHSDKQLMDYTDKDDGVFFIEYDRLRTYFEDIQICQYRDHYIYEGLSVATSQGEQEHFFKVVIPPCSDQCGDGYYYFQVNQVARAEFGEDSYYEYTKATVNVIDERGNWVSATTGRQKNLCSYLSQQKPKTLSTGTYYVLAKVKFGQYQAEENIRNFGFGVYGQQKVQITPLSSTQIGSQLANVLRSPSSSVQEVLPSFII